MQPTFFLVAAIVLTAKAGPLRYGQVLAFVPPILLSIVYQENFASWTLTDFLRLSFSATAYLFFVNFSHRLDQRFIFYVSLVSLGLLSLHFLAPGLFIAVFEPFVRIIKIDAIGVRGASGLAPEPGLAGAVAVSTLAISTYLKDFRGDDRYYWKIFSMAIFTVFMTRSGTGTLYLLIFLSLYYLRPKHFLMLFAFIFMTSMLLLNYEFGRGSIAVLGLLTNPASTLQSDTSIGGRVLNFLVGFASIVERPFGYGFGNYAASATEIAAKYELNSVAQGKIGNLSSFATYSVYMGIFWWIFVFWIFVSPIWRAGMRIIPYLAIAFILSSMSLSVAFPLTWALVALCHSPPLRSRTTPGRQVREMALHPAGTP